MKIGIISFTARGAQVCRQLLIRFLDMGVDCMAWAPARFIQPSWKEEGVREQNQKVEQWSRSMFEQGRALIFVGAVGIAVRAIAPWMKDKMTDPPVVAVDEGMHFVIPLLSGHVGGANELARTIAAWLKAVPVITTATDVNGVFAVDLFAASHKLVIGDRAEAKAVSAALLEGKQVGFWNDFSQSEPPLGCILQCCERNIWITVKSEESCCPLFEEDREKKHCLRLVPKALVLGIGCKKGIRAEELKLRICQVLGQEGIDQNAVKAIATIDIKKEETGLLEVAKEYGWELRFYGSEELKKVEGTFAESDFVKKITGVGNVCERAAAASGGTLFIHKQSGRGITVAAALERQGDWNKEKGFGGEIHIEKWKTL